MSPTRNPGDRLANVTGAVALGLYDAMAGATTAATGLDPAGTTTLIALLDFTPGGSIGRLRAVLGVTHSGAVRIVDRLTAAGLVARGSTADGRERAITLTRAGRRVARRARAARASALAHLLDELSPAERAALEPAVSALAAAVTRDRLSRRATGEEPTGGALCRWCDFGACGRPDGDCPVATTTAAVGTVRPSGQRAQPPPTRPERADRPASALPSD